MFTRRKKERPPDDDGRTIVNMNVEGMPWYHPESEKKVKESDKPSRKERRALIRAGYLAYLPRILSILFGFTVVFLLMWLWLHGWKF